jgi:hypothetical protein
MFVIKIKEKDLFYNNRNKHGFHSDIQKADVYNTYNGAMKAKQTLQYWWNLGVKDSNWERDYHKYIKDFDQDVEIREVTITLK